MRRLVRDEQTRVDEQRALGFEDEDLTGLDRPKTRAGCENVPRPCPFVSCRYNLYLDVNPETGSIKINFPDVEVEDMRHSCTLDVAEMNGVTLEEVGAIMNLTRERIRQVEVRGLLKLKDDSAEDLGEEED